MKFLKAKIKFVVIYKNDTVEYLNKEELSKKIRGKAPA